MKKDKMFQFLIMLSFLALWQTSAMLMNVYYIFPTPIQVIKKLYELREPLLFFHMPYTFTITVGGLLISIILGFILAISMDYNKKVASIVYPIVVTSQTVPITALAPLFILWFGYGITAKIVVTVIITFFPITISMHDGFKNTKREHIELMRSFGADEFTIFRKLKLMSALPSFFSALKMSIPISIIGAAIGEWLGSQQGLGYFSKRMLTQLSGAGVFAPIVLLSVVAVLLVNFINIIEKKVLGNWRAEL